MTELSIVGGGLRADSAPVDACRDTVGVVDAEPTLADAPLRAEAMPFRTFEAVAPLLEGLEGSTFQSPFWLANWFVVIGQDSSVDPLLVMIRDARGEVLLACPLVRRREGGVTVLEFPDLGVSDYAAPLLRRDSVARLPQGEALWALIAGALPPTDLLRFERLCPTVAGMANPLYDHPRARLNRLTGWVTPTVDSWEGFRSVLSGRQRENSAKNRRRFLRQPDAEIVIHNDPEAALAALARLDALQESRMREKGQAYQLNNPRIAAFYRRLVETGLAEGKTLIAELRAGGETIAANLTVLSGQEAVYLRVGSRYGEWSRMSPGVIVTEVAIEEALGRGARVFDFAMGDYVYKRRLGGAEMKLRDLVLPLSLRGAPSALLWHARQWASRNPLMRRLTGRRLAAENAAEGNEERPEAGAAQGERPADSVVR